jgi:hypothetical protein
MKLTGRTLIQAIRADQTIPAAAMRLGIDPTWSHSLAQPAL